MQQMNFKGRVRQTLTGPLTLVVLVLAAWRLAEFFFPEAIPANFTPMLAIALFAGSTFSRSGPAYAVPLAAMVISDLVIGFSGLSPLIYGLIAISVWLGARTLHGRAGCSRVLWVAAGSATGFFLITNLAVWVFFDLYPHTPAGLLAAYVAAIPFYLHGTLAGTVFFSVILFALRAGLVNDAFAAP